MITVSEHGVPVVNANYYAHKVEKALNDFLVENGHTLETFGEFIKELDDRKTIIQIEMNKEECTFTLVELDEGKTTQLFEHFNQDVYLQAQCLEIAALMACVEEGFEHSQTFSGRFLFSKEAQVLYSYNRKDFDGDVIRPKKLKRKQRQGGEFVQETHFRRSNNARRRY